MASPAPKSLIDLQVSRGTLTANREISEAPIVKPDESQFHPALIASSSISTFAVEESKEHGLSQPLSLPIIRVSKSISPAAVSEIATATPSQDTTLSMVSLKDDLQQLQVRLQALDVSPLSPADLREVLSFSVNTPTAYGGSEGASALSFGYQQLRNFGVAKNGSDGVVGAVVSFGKPAKVGVDVAFNLLDLSHHNGGGFAKRGSLSIKAHKVVAQNFAVALGADNLLDYGDNGIRGPSYYGVLSRGVHLKQDAREPFSDLYLSLGIGTNRFRSERRFLADKGTFGVFGSAALKVNQSFNVFTEWTGQDLNVGIAVQPFHRVPLIITPTLADLTGHAGNRTRYLIGVNYLLPFGLGRR